MPTVDIPPVRLPSIDALSDPDALAAVVGPVASIERSPWSPSGTPIRGTPWSGLISASRLAVVGRLCSSGPRPR